MATLAQLQRWAETDARRLGLTHTIKICWGGEPGGDGHGGKACKFPSGAHAHTYEAKRTGIARICIRRDRGVRWLITHEVAHFAPGGERHGLGHVRAQARAGSRSARNGLVARGKARCSKHRWLQGRLLSRKVTSTGVTLKYAMVCGRCGKRLEPKAKAVSRAA